MNIIEKTKKMIGKIFTKKSKNAELSRLSQDTPDLSIDPSLPVKEYSFKDVEPSFLYESGEVLEIAERLLQHLERAKPFLNPKLKLGDLAEDLNTNRNYLSRTINGYLRINFSQLCNYFRVREACMVFLRNPDIGNKDWMRLSGFSSVSSFAGCFSNYTGLSPAKWQREVLQRIKNKEYLSADDYIKDFKTTLYR